MLTLCTVTERIAIIGASRGIGSAISLALESQHELLLVSRKWSAPNSKSERLSLDLAKEDDVEILLSHLQSFKAMRIFYVAGGGPHGDFYKKEFKDHQWAWRVNLLTPARILHWGLNQTFIKQMIFFGSAIAESQADPLAASYASAKHGLVGLIKSVWGEKPSCDVRLYSLGYVATDLLPKNVQEKLKPKLEEPGVIVHDFIKWAFSDGVEPHRIFTNGR